MLQGPSGEPTAPPFFFPLPFASFFPFLLSHRARLCGSHSRRALRRGRPPQDFFFSSLLFTFGYFACSIPGTRAHFPAFFFFLYDIVRKGEAEIIARALTKRTEIPFFPPFSSPARLDNRRRKTKGIPPPPLPSFLSPYIRRRRSASTSSV